MGWTWQNIEYHELHPKSFWVESGLRPSGSLPGRNLTLAAAAAAEPTSERPGFRTIGLGGGIDGDTHTHVPPPQPSQCHSQEIVCVKFKIPKIFGHHCKK